MSRRIWLRVVITLRQNGLALGFAGAWLVCNALVFWGVFHLPAEEAAAVAVCIHKMEGAWGRVYTSFTELFVLGAVASVIVADATRRYRPELTCAALAGRAQDHVVIVGFSNLGKRIRDLSVRTGATVVVVEDNRVEVEDLIQAEEPVVLGNTQKLETLRAARIERAAVVVIATDDLETAAVACRLARSENPKCKLVVRCSDDDVGQILAKAYAARVLSTSKIAARYILQFAKKSGARRALVMGRNNVGKRVSEALSADAIDTTLIDVTEDEKTLEQAGVRKVDLVVVADDDLGKNLIRVDRIRDLNPECHLLCRVFHDDAAELLTGRPFRCSVLSTSRLAAELLVEEGIFREAGIPRTATQKNQRQTES